jgi:hypothetical protein
VSRSWRGQGVGRTPKTPIREGTIVWAPITPDGGVVKMRRSVVLFNPARDPTGTIWVVGVTSDGGEYDPSDTVAYDPELFFPMPFAKDGSHATTFTVPCAAKMTWVQGFTRDKIEVTDGFLPAADFDALVERLKAYRRKLRASEPKNPPAGT